MSWDIWRREDLVTGDKLTASDLDAGEFVALNGGYGHCDDTVGMDEVEEEFADEHDGAEFDIDEPEHTVWFDKRFVTA